MKIVILSPSTKTVGGVERFCEYLKKVYIEEGHEAFIICGAFSKWLKLFTILGLKAPFNGWLVGRAAKKEGFDVLVTNGFLGWNVKNGKIINVQHGNFAAAADRIDWKINKAKWFVKKFIWSNFEKIAAKRANFVVAVSRETANSVKKYYKINKVLVIPNTIDFDKFSPQEMDACRKKFSLPKNKRLLLFVGRFEFGKGADIIRDVLPEVVKKGWQLVTATNMDVNLPGVISFKNVSYDELPFLYAACDMFVFPSRHEGCSLALIEAMGCNLPFLATHTGSIDEIVNADETYGHWVAQLSAFKEKLILRMDSPVITKLPEREVAESIFSYKNFRQSYLALLSKIIF